MATPETVSAILLALLATDSLAETDERIGRLADAQFVGTGLNTACELTGTSNLKDALASILTNERKNSHFVGLRVSRSNLSAAIYFANKRGGTTRASLFGQSAARTGIEVEAILRAEVLQVIFLGLELSYRVPDAE